jgi:hypothetical protein
LFKAAVLNHANICSQSDEMSAHHCVKSPLTISEMRNDGQPERADVGIALGGLA